LELSYNDSVTERFTNSSRDNLSEAITTVSPEVTTNNTSYDEKTITNHKQSEKDQNTLHFETTTDSLTKITPTTAETTTTVPKHEPTPHPYHKHIKNVWIGGKTRGRKHMGSMHHLSLGRKRILSNNSFENIQIIILILFFPS